MMVSKDFIKNISKIAAAEFNKAGWTRRKLDIFSADLSEDVYGSVGLNRAISRREAIVEINPVLGVGSRKLEKLVAELLGEKVDRYYGTAIATQIGYLMPEKSYTPWLFREGENCKQLAAQMVSAIEKFGRPFIQRYAEFPALFEAMTSSNLGASNMLDYRIAAGYLLLGKPTDAEAFLNAKLAEMVSRTDMAAESFRKFAARMRDNLRKGSGI